MPCCVGHSVVIAERAVVGPEPEEEVAASQTIMLDGTRPEEVLDVAVVIAIYIIAVSDAAEGGVARLYDVAIGRVGPIGGFPPYAGDTAIEGRRGDAGHIIVWAAKGELIRCAEAGVWD